MHSALSREAVRRADFCWGQLSQPSSLLFSPSSSGGLYGYEYRYTTFSSHTRNRLHHTHATVNRNTLLLLACPASLVPLSYTPLSHLSANTFTSAPSCSTGAKSIRSSSVMMVITFFQYSQLLASQHFAFDPGGRLLMGSTRQLCDDLVRTNSLSLSA